MFESICQVRDNRPKLHRRRRRVRPEAASRNRRRQCLSENRSSRYLESRAGSAAYVGPLVAAETTQKLEKTRFRLDRPITP